MIDAPGTVNYIASQDIDCSNNYALLKENITLLNSCNGIKFTDENDGNKTTCRGGSNHIRKVQIQMFKKVIIKIIKISSGKM